MFRSNTRAAAGLLSGLALVSVASTATAQTPESNDTSFQVERFEPMPAQGINTLNLAGSDLVPHLKPTGGLFFHYVKDPLVQVDEDDNLVQGIVTSQVKTELWGGIGLYDMADIGIVFPFVLSQSGDGLDVFGDAEGAVSGAALQDMRLVPKFRFLDPEDFHGVGAALLTTLWLPTGDQDTFNGDGALKFEPRVAVDWRHDLGILVQGNLGYQFRKKKQAQNYVYDDVLRWGIGGRYDTPMENLEVVASLFGDIQLAKNVDVVNAGEAIKDGKGSPVELDGGVQYALPYDLIANLGVGTGLSNGVGAPGFRFFASIGYTPRATDTDGDGIYDDEDQCPTDPEDLDGFEDVDGCPDHDNDADGILDVDDQCPMDPEDIDGFEDENGCPDPDNDQDTVLDVDDQCPNEPGPVERQGCPEKDRDGDGLLDEVDKCPDDPEDKDGFEDEDGCPDLDNDKDTILDADDQCPLDPEDLDGFEDENGCPDPDNDQDKILDVDDRCPNEPETYNQKEDEDGCPDAKDTKVRITKTKIEILEKVYFDTGKATIKQRSFALLNQVADVLNNNPQITKIRVEGHTDDRGKDEYNQKLSDDRAASVMKYLVDNGKVDAARLESKGFGETTPIADNKTSAGRSQNRRVEFTILSVNGKPVGDGPAIIEKPVEVEEKTVPEGDKKPE